MTVPQMSTREHDSNDVRLRMSRAGIRLPSPAAPNFTYTPVMVWGDVAFVSGQIPKEDGRLAFTGRAGDGNTSTDAFAAAELCAANALAHLDNVVGLDQVAQVLKLNGYVACTPEFTEHPHVMEGASRFLEAALGPAGRHARTALGVPRLPADALVEIELIVGLRPKAEKPVSAGPGNNGPSVHR
ncbi:RidA family protein [Citricoccus alkalitolerans]|uniref:RidA family protein n=1 Tax=Citricoccus alkalitolerans TaxID=246603 RepID=A0ABV8XU78_9MICC